MNKLEGKIALITGGTSGIGKATAQQFVHEGAYVFITGRRDVALTAAAKEIGSQVIGVQADVSNLGDLDRLFARIQRERARSILSSPMPASPPLTPLWARSRRSTLTRCSPSM